MNKVKKVKSEREGHALCGPVILRVAKSPVDSCISALTAQHPSHV